jgi:hypothetical protein
MATEIFNDTIKQLAKDYKGFRKETLNQLGEKGEGKNIDYTFKDYVTQYFSFLETQEDFEDDEDLEEESEDIEDTE